MSEADHVTNEEKAKNWARFADAACTEMGRLGALRAALKDSPKVLELVLKELELQTAEEILVWAWKAKSADNAWLRAKTP
jgi:hypothetical protein